MKEFFNNVWFWIKIVIAVIAIPIVVAIAVVLSVLGYAVSLVVALVVTIVKDSYKFWKPVCSLYSNTYTFIEKALRNPNSFVDVAKSDIESELMSGIKV